MPYKPVKLICQYCGKEFFGENRKDRPRLFCSRQCGGKGRTKAKTTKRLMKRIEKHCKICGKSFLVIPNSSSKNNLRIYCSKKCKGIGSRNKPIKCEICGEEFIRTKKHASRRFCSKECSCTYRQTGEKIKCEICGKQVYKHRTHINKAKHYFCCLAHANEWQRKTKILIRCTICGKEYYVSPTNKNRKYCSQDCRNKDPEVKKRLISMNVKQQNLYPNKLEKTGYDILDSIKIPYEKQFLIGNKFLVDAFIKEYGIIIQFDGDYWHGNPKKYDVFSDRQQKRINIDHSQNEYFKKCGYKILRFWESDIHKNPDNIRDVILQNVSLNE